MSIIILIKIVVCLLGGLGLISFALAWLHLCRHDQPAFDKVCEKCGEELINHKKLQELREDVTNVPHDSLMGERIGVISAIDISASLAPPQLQDMHRLSEQAMFSRLAPTLLRIISNILLIVGICGTLWGVHNALNGSPGSSSNMFLNMSEALEPSKFAVLGTIILLICRGFFEARVERHICRVDSFTMSRLLPGLQGESGYAKELSDFTKSIHTFSESLSLSKEITMKLSDWFDSLPQQEKELIMVTDTLKDIHQQLLLTEQAQLDTEQQQSREEKAAQDLLLSFQVSTEDYEKKLQMIVDNWNSLHHTLSHLSTDAVLTDKARQAIETLTNQISNASTKLEEALQMQLTEQQQIQAQLKTINKGLHDELPNMKKTVNQLIRQLEQIKTNSDSQDKSLAALEDMMNEMNQLFDTMEELTQHERELMERVQNATKDVVMTTKQIEGTAADGMTQLDSLHQDIMRSLSQRP